MYAKLTEEQKREFIEVYLKYREDGRTKIRDAYKAARMEMAAANKPAPAFSTFETLLRQGRKAAEAPREEVPEETAAEEESGEDALREENKILRGLLRIALAYAQNADLNDLADRVIPDLLPEA